MNNFRFNLRGFTLNLFSFEKRTSSLFHTSLTFTNITK